MRTAEVGRLWSSPSSFFWCFHSAFWMAALPWSWFFGVIGWVSGETAAPGCCFHNPATGRALLVWRIQARILRFRHLGHVPTTYKWCGPGNGIPWLVPTNRSPPLGLCVGHFLLVLGPFGDEWLFCFSLKFLWFWVFPGGPLVKIHAPNAEGLGSIPGQGTRSCMPQLNILQVAMKILCAPTKTQSSQINNFLKILVILRKERGMHTGIQQ